MRPSKNGSSGPWPQCSFRFLSFFFFFSFFFSSAEATSVRAPSPQAISRADCSPQKTDPRGEPPGLGRPALLLVSAALPHVASSFQIRDETDAVFVERLKEEQAPVSEKIHELGTSSRRASCFSRMLVFLPPPHQHHHLFLFFFPLADTWRQNMVSERQPSMQSRSVSSLSRRCATRVSFLSP